MSVSLFKLCDNVAAALAFKSASLVAVVADASLSGTTAVLLPALEFDIIFFDVCIGQSGEGWLMSMIPMTDIVQRLGESVCDGKMGGAQM